MNTLDFKLTPMQRLLGLCMRHCDFLEKDQIRFLYDELGDARVHAAAEENGLVPIVAHALTVVYGCENVSSHWKEAYNQTEQRIAAYMQELDKVAHLLQQHDIELIALKNSGITRGLYPYPGASPMGDIDVLVSKEKFRNAHAVLTETGYQLKFRCPFEEDSIDAAEQGGGAEYSVILPDGEHLWFELQWRPVAGRWIRPEQEPVAGDLIARSIAIQDSAVRLLSPEDNLLQVALHMAKHTFVRAPGVRLHTDVERIVSTQKIDWDDFVRKACELRIRTAVFFSLALAKVLVGTPIPDNVLANLSPVLWKKKLMCRWLLRVGLFSPDAPKWGKLGYIVFVSLLYDSLRDLVSGVFPSSDSMKAEYGFHSSWKLPIFHARRIYRLLVFRAKT